MTAGELTVRKMKPADVGPLLEIERVSFPVPWSESMFLIQLAMEDEVENLVAMRGGSIAGYICSWYGFEELHILSIAVSPEEMGQGAAAMLLAEALSRGRVKGSLKAVLEVRENNGRAIRFYKKHRFVEVGRRKGYYTDSGEDALILEKAIDDIEESDRCSCDDRGEE
jgi:ribosomal-protein-alanine N-acetyltransferase